MEKLIWTDEDKFFITTFNKRLYDDYAHKFLQTYAETKQTIKMIGAYFAFQSSIGLVVNIRWLNNGTKSFNFGKRTANSNE